MEKDERWLPVVGFEGRYEVSDRGRVRCLVINRTGGRNGSVSLRANPQSRPVPRILQLGISSNGYVSANLTNATVLRKYFHVHTLVAAAFIGPRPDGKQVAHGDGCKTNNRPENLRYVTAKENAADRERHGRTRRGDKSGRAKLTEAIVREIRARYVPACRHNGALAMSREFGVCGMVLRRAIHGVTWAHVV